MKSGISRALACVLSLSLVSLNAQAGTAGATKVGEFQANQADSQDTGVGSSIATDDAGNLTVVFTRRDDSGYTMFGRRFDAAGNEITPEFHLYDGLAGSYINPAVAASATTGDFVVAFTGDVYSGSSDDGVYVRLFNADGSPKGDAFRVDNATGVPSAPRVAMHRSGQFVVAWSDAANLSGSAPYHANAVVFDAQGQPLATAQQLALDATSAPTVAGAGIINGGLFSVAWYQNASSVDTGYDTYVNCFDPSGNSFRGDVLVSSPDARFNGPGASAQGDDGTVIAAVYSLRPDAHGGYNENIHARVFDFSCGEASVDIKASPDGIYLAQVAPSVRLDSRSGQAAIGWMQRMASGSTLVYNGFISLLDFGGNPLASPILVNSSPQVLMTSPLVGFDHNGDLWSAWGQDDFSTTSYDDIFAASFFGNPVGKPELSPSFDGNFGGVRVGETSAPHDLTVTNVGTGPLRVGTPRFQGYAPQDYAVVSNTCPAEIPPQQSCVISVTFTPDRWGTRFQAEIVLPTNAGYDTDIGMTGDGLQGAMAVSSPNPAFGSRHVGTTSQPSRITVTDFGTDTLTLGTPTIANDSTGSYAIVGNDCPASLEPSQSCTISVTFTPQRSGTLVGEVRISGSDPSCPCGTGLYGVGTQPMLSATAPQPSFGSRTVGTTSAPSEITLTNVGNESLTLGTPSLSGDAAADYNIVSNSCGNALDASASCSIGLTFTPRSRGYRFAQLDIANNDPNCPCSVGFFGNGLMAQISIDGPSPAFSDQPVGTSSAPSDLQITNVGNDTLALATISINGDAASDFAIATSSCGSALAPGAACDLNIRFTPSSIGNRTAQVHIDASSPDCPCTVDLAGVGTQPAISVSDPGPFGNVSVGSTSAPRSVTVANYGNATLVLGNPSFTGAAARDYAVGGNTCAGGVQPWQSCAIAVTFTPSDVGPRYAELVVPSNAPGSPSIVSLSGFGLKAATSLAPRALITVQPLKGKINFNPAATLTTKSGKPVAGRAVRFVSGSTALCTGVTGTDGQATCVATVTAHISAVLSAGYTANFDGDDAYLSSSGSGALACVGTQCTLLLP